MACKPKGGNCGRITPVEVRGPRRRGKNLPKEGKEGKEVLEVVGEEEEEQETMGTCRSRPAQGRPGRSS
jgi:hypothetical protein